ncbi:MAG: radical SAM protein [Lentisphaerae bacterium]|nr:radical SAM protein [Lentisphaerota bacterium]
MCPRRCGANRLAGQSGFCGAGADAEIFRWGAHAGEEPPISGVRGSGTVFFSRCTLRCCYCQNHPWSQEGRGESYRPEELATVFRRLRELGCHNWNLVSPTPWLPMIAEALAAAKTTGPRLPVIYNTSGFERLETLRTLEGLVDVYLTDVRYAAPASALEGSGNAEVVDIARAAIRRMWAQAGPLRCDAEGLAVAGVICRLLVLPGRAAEACDNLGWLAETIGTDIALSVMSQYTPAHLALKREPWNRRVTREEYGRVCRTADDLGFTNGWIQEYNDTRVESLIGFAMSPTPKSALRDFFPANDAK